MFPVYGKKVLKLKLDADQVGLRTSLQITAEPLSSLAENPTYVQADSDKY